jgi:ABC-type dipeptide/oligopeptide/nickel transport system permease subunit
MDEPKGLKEFALTTDSIARAVWYFLLFAARYSLTSAFLISISASPIIGGLLGRLSSRARRGQLKAKGQHCYL